MERIKLVVLCVSLKTFPSTLISFKFDSWEWLYTYYVRIDNVKWYIGIGKVSSCMSSLERRRTTVLVRHYDVQRYVLSRSSCNWVDIRCKCIPFCREKSGNFSIKASYQSRVWIHLCLQKYHKITPTKFFSTRHEHSVDENRYATEYNSYRKQVEIQKIYDESVPSP